MSNTYLHLREEQQKRLDVAMSAPIEQRANAIFTGQLDKALQQRCTGGSCSQGRKKCETPEACYVPVDEANDVFDLYWALFAVALLLVPIATAAFFLVDNWPILVSLWSI